MTSGLFLAAIGFSYLIAGLASIQLGLTTTLITVASKPSSPESTGGFFDAVRAVLAVGIWVFNVLGSVWQLIAFQAEIPTLASCAAPKVVEAAVASVLAVAKALTYGLGGSRY